LTRGSITAEVFVQLWLTTNSQAADHLHSASLFSPCLFLQ